MIKEKEIAQIIAELETTFKLPVESQVLKGRYKNLQEIQKTVEKLEEKYSKLSSQNSANSSIIQALTQRRDFLANLYQSLLNGSKLRKNASQIFATTETKIKNEIMQLEEALKNRENSVQRLKAQIEVEGKKLKNAKFAAESNKEIVHKNEADFAEFEKQKETLQNIFEADQKVVKKMEEYFFKMTTNLFELQREIDKRTLHLTPEKASMNNNNEVENGEATSSQNKLKGWHQISHIMEDMGKDQAKYLKNGINENNFENDNKWELNEKERQWLKRELTIQKQKSEENEAELKKIVIETKAVTKEFLNVIEETETLLKKYAAVECKNMTTDLRNARLQILAATTKYEPETPMYKKYHETIEESAVASEKPEFQELYTRKIANAKSAEEEAEKFEQEIRKRKVNIRKDLYWMDKGTEDQSKISEIQESIEKMDPTLLKEFLRAMIIGGSLSASSETPEISLPDFTATQLTEFLKQMTASRNRLFEIHLKKCSQIYLEDIKRISDAAANLENDVRSLEKNLTESKKERTKEEEFCERLKERIKIIEEKAAKKKEEVKEADDKSGQQWAKEVRDLEEKLFEANESREKARIEKLNVQEEIRSAQIEENNLRHRFNVFQSLKKSEKEGRKQFKNSEQLFETEKNKNQQIIAETEAMAKILEEALKQEAKLEKAIEKGFIQESVSEEQKALEAEKQELEAELEYLLSIEQKIKSSRM